MSRRSISRLRAFCESTMPEDPQVRSKPIINSEDYEISLPDWLRDCIKEIPPGLGQSCPTDSDALLAGAFDLAFQLHEGQFRASGDPYIVHPVAVADLLREIGASSTVIAAGFLHGYVNNMSLKESLEKGTEMSSQVIQQIGARL